MTRNAHWPWIRLLLGLSPILLLWGGCLMATGRLPMPGISYSLAVTSSPRTGPLAESPDGKAFAYPVWNENERAAIGLNTWPLTPGSPLVVSRSFDLYVYDLVARGAPRRILRWTDRDVDQTTLFCWSPAGIIVRRGPAPWAPWLVDPRTGRARPMAGWTERELQRLSDDAHRIDTRVIPETRFHAEQDVDQFFLWNPIAHHREWLFDLPLVYDGHPDRFADAHKRYRFEHRYLASFHRVGDISSTCVGDSVRLSIFAYALEPGERWRPYRLVVHIDVPDTSGWRGGTYGSRAEPLDSVVVLCPPDSVTLHRGYALRRLASYIRRVPRRGGGEIEDGVWRTGIEAELQPLPLPGGFAIPPEIRNGSSSMNAGRIAVPLVPME